MAATKTDDSRLKAFISESVKLPDAGEVIAERPANIEAIGPKGIPVTRHAKFVITTSHARVDFGDFVAQALRPDEALSSEAFQFLRDEYSHYQQANPDFNSLNDAQREKYMRSIDEARDTLLDAFSPANTALASDSGAQISKRQIRDALTDMPETLEQVDSCFHEFCEDATMKSILVGSDVAQQFKAFRVARVAAGVTETEATRKALDEYAHEFGLAS